MGFCFVFRVAVLFTFRFVRFVFAILGFVEGGYMLFDGSRAIDRRGSVNAMVLAGRYDPQRSDDRTRKCARGDETGGLTALGR